MLNRQVGRQEISNQNGRRFWIAQKNVNPAFVRRALGRLRLQPGAGAGGRLQGLIPEALPHRVEHAAHLGGATEVCRKHMLQRYAVNFPQNNENSNITRNPERGLEFDCTIEIFSITKGAEGCFDCRQSHKIRCKTGVRRTKSLAHWANKQTKF